MRDPESIATVFEVYDEDPGVQEKAVKVDPGEVVWSGSEF